MNDDSINWAILEEDNEIQKNKIIKSKSNVEKKKQQNKIEGYRGAAILNVSE